MLIGHPRQRVYLAVGATDLRKAVDGLAAIVQLDFELNPFEPCLFAFCNRMRNKVKILEWSERGFWLHYFGLEEGKLPLAPGRRRIQSSRHHLARLALAAGRKTFKTS